MHETLSVVGAIASGLLIMFCLGTWFNIKWRGNWKIWFGAGVTSGVLAVIQVVSMLTIGLKYNRTGIVWLIAYLGFGWWFFRGARKLRANLRGPKLYVARESAGSTRGRN